jgi:hypothetical protein
LLRDADGDAGEMRAMCQLADIAAARSTQNSSIFIAITAS